MIGIVGGGQLARMMAQAAISLGLGLELLSVAADDAAAQVIPRTFLGEHTDLAALRALATDCDVVTFDHEHVPGSLIRQLTAEGHRLLPSAAALHYAQDKAAMRTRLASIGAPIPDFAVTTAAELPAALTAFRARGHQGTVVLKTATGGYDGRGVYFLQPGDRLPELAREGTLVLEQYVPLSRELAALVARSSTGELCAWPVVETVQRDGICVEVIAPAPNLSSQQAAAATELALQLAQELDVVGVLAVELFATDTGLVVNELAMRPHNSGHWTIDGAVTGQFEQHLRAVAGWPLGLTAARQPVSVMANVLGGSATGAGAAVPIAERIGMLAARLPNAKVHWYGKGIRPGRKLGHVTVCGNQMSSARRDAVRGATILGTGIDEEGITNQ